jgi:anti-sigma factor RsiW
MTCEHAAQVHRYHDGALSPAEQASVEAHLAVCAECRELLEDLQKLSHLFATVPLPQVTTRAMNRMQGSWWAAATRKAAEDQSLRRLASWMTAVAATVLVCVPLSTPSGQVRVEQPQVAGAWSETLALIPPEDIRDVPSYDLVQVAQWMANDVDIEQRQ